MERRETEDRRQVHMFVAQERRDGPYERRGDATRRRERKQEREKIERIRAFKEKKKASLPVTPVMTKKRWVYLGLALLVIVVAVFLIK
ncbi:MAG: hypothetical protein HGJ94_13515 [Desulfosarcina sp.]|nr:hypothetical protein [Desulfosarcina sp.]